MSESLGETIERIKEKRCPTASARLKKWQMREIENRRRTKKHNASQPTRKKRVKRPRRPVHFPCPDLQAVDDAIRSGRSRLK
jgi:hypothetical protein